MYRVLVVLVLAFLVTGCSTQKTTQPPVSTTSTKEADVSLTKQFSEHPGVLPDDQIKGKQVAIRTEKGAITFKLFPDEAPLAVSNFVFLAGEKFYDGLTFHRVEPGFVVQ